MVSLRVLAGQPQRRRADLAGRTDRRHDQRRRGGRPPRRARHRPRRDMGGDLRRRCGTQATTMGINVLSEYRTRKRSRLLGDVAIRPTLPGERTRADQGQPAAPADGRAVAAGHACRDRALRATIYGPNHPYGRVDPDRGAARRAIRSTMSRRFHAAKFGAKRAHLYIAGQFDAGGGQGGGHQGVRGWAPAPEPLTLAAIARARARA